MTDQEKILLTNFELKVKQVIAQVDVLKQEKLALLEKVKNMEESVNQLRKENMVLEQKYQNLKLAKLFVAPDDGTKDAKSKIQNIVREIDKCIALLNK
jgi:phage shock protein A